MYDVTDIYQSKTSQIFTNLRRHRYLPIYDVTDMYQFRTSQIFTNLGRHKYLPILELVFTLSIRYH